MIELLGGALQKKGSRALIGQGRRNAGQQRSTIGLHRLDKPFKDFQ